MIKKEALIRDKIGTIADVLDRACGTDQVIDLSSYYRALTTDIIASFAFGRDMDLLHDPDKAERLYAVWRAEWKRMARYEPLGLRNKVLPWVQWFVSLLPARRASEMDSGSIAAFNDYQEVCGVLAAPVVDTDFGVPGDENIYLRHAKRGEEITEGFRKG